jgi:hypothetical protein
MNRSSQRVSGDKMLCSKLTSTIIVISFIALGCTSGTTSGNDDNEQQIYDLSTIVKPTNAGKINPSQGEFEAGTEVEIIAKSNQHWLFAGWQGDHEGMDNPATLTMDKDKLISANFVKKKYTLNVAIEGEGIVNEKKLVDKSNEYKHGSQVELTAVPSDDWEFIQWKGDISRSGNPTIINIDNASTNVIAQFIESDCSIIINISNEYYELESHKRSGNVYDYVFDEYESHLRVFCNDNELSFYGVNENLEDINKYMIYSIESVNFIPNYILRDDELNIDKIKNDNGIFGARFTISDFHKEIEYGEIVFTILIKLKKGISYTYLKKLKLEKKYIPYPGSSLKLISDTNKFRKISENKFEPPVIEVILKRDNLLGPANWSIGDSTWTTYGTPEKPDTLYLHPSYLNQFENKKGILKVYVYEKDIKYPSYYGASDEFYIDDEEIK